MHPPSAPHQAGRGKSATALHPPPPCTQVSELSMAAKATSSPSPAILRQWAPCGPETYMTISHMHAQRSKSLSSSIQRHSGKNPMPSTNSRHHYFIPAYLHSTSTVLMSTRAQICFNMHIRATGVQATTWARHSLAARQPDRLVYILLPIATECYCRCYCYS